VIRLWTVPPLPPRDVDDIEEVARMYVQEALCVCAVRVWVLDLVTETTKADVRDLLFDNLDGP